MEKKVTVDFSKVTVRDIEDQEQVVDLRRELGNRLYYQSRDISQAELGRRIYHSEGPMHLTESEADIVRQSAAPFVAYVREPLLKALAPSQSQSVKGGSPAKPSQTS